MKTALTPLALLFFLQATAFAKIVMMDDKVYLRKDGKQVPVFLVNDLIDKEKVKKVHLFGEGKVHLISFAIEREREKLYSVDEQGYVYAINPFSDYEINKITENEFIQFRQIPGKSYRVTEKGFFVH